MDKPVIGIRQADGSFYEILDEAAVGHKRLTLSAARTDQKGVRIELFRSTAGSNVPEESLGSIALEDAEGLGYQDIEFRLDVSEGRLDASANLPGQPPQRLSVDLSTDDEAPHRTDAAILEDESLSTGLDTLDDSFSDPEAEPTMLDLPDLRDEAETGAPESFDLPDLDEPNLDEPDLNDPDLAGPDLAMPGLDPEGDSGDVEAEAGLDSFEMPTMDDMPAMSDEDMPVMEDPSEFTMDDMSMDDMSMEDEAETKPAPSAPAADDAFSLDDLGDMEPMEFMDTGAELSSPTARPVSAPSPAEDDSFDVSMDDSDSKADFGDMADFGDLPEMEMDDVGPAATSSSDDDLDFMAPPELTETPWADEDEVAPVAAKGKGKRAKPPKAAKAPKARARGDVPVPAPQGGGLDKTALFLSLTSLSLLVLLILVLLFLNMIKSPQAPVIQPEVMKFTPATPLAQRKAPVSVDLNKGTTFEASTVLEVPEALRTAEVSLTLAPGDTAADAERRFGTPAKSRGNQLFW